MKVTTVERVEGKIAYIKMMDSLNSQLIAIEGTKNNAVLQF
jgi:hypothetical protein